MGTPEKRIRVRGEDVHMGTARYSGEFKRDTVALAEHMRADLVVGAIRAAADVRGGDARGVGSTPIAGRNTRWRRSPRSARGTGNAARWDGVGSSCDRALAESSCATLKGELRYGSRRLTQAQARIAVFAWMACYTRKWRHSSLGYRRSDRLRAAARRKSLPWAWLRNRRVSANWGSYSGIMQPSRPSPSDPSDACCAPSSRAAVGTRHLTAGASRRSLPARRRVASRAGVSGAGSSL
ncbi:integrase core domain-containing protein [Streptomyces hydrogenans]